MTPDQIDLARRAVACPRWRWMPGMTAIPLSHERERWLLCWCEEDGSEAGGYQTTGGKWWGIATSDLPMVLREGWVPDLTDPATLGCILALVREAWRCPTVYARQGTTRRISDGVIAWEVCDLWLDADACRALGVDRQGSVGSWGHGSEAEALVAALEAAQ